MSMTDPSEKVQGALLGHLHLVVTQNAPLQFQQLHIEQALDQLLKAPQLVRNKAVSWHYWHAPQNGSTFVTWQPGQLNNVFASDGYVWSGPEQVFSKDIRGYTVQIFLAELGFSPGVEQFAAHRRWRYKLVASPNGQHDSSLEFVHYVAAPEQQHIAARSIGLTPQIQTSMSQRSFLEKQGGLARKEFMLHDRTNYPTITIPGPPIPGNPYQPHQPYLRGAMQRPQPSVPGMRGQPPGPSPNKRPPTGGQRLPGGMMGNPFAAPNPSVSEALVDEDNHFYGDALDFLTPKEISTARYKQHHDWMDEIISSPYTLSQILPLNLGLRLYGEGGQLTDGLWEDGLQTETKGLDFDALQRTGYDGGMNKSNVEKLEERVNEYLKKGQEQLTQMKEAHRLKMQDMAGEKLFTTLEKRLAERSDNARVAEVTRDAEAAISSQICLREHVQLIQKGGVLEQGEENHYNEPAPVDEFADFTEMDTAGEALDQWIDYNK